MITSVLDRLHTLTCPQKDLSTYLLHTAAGAPHLAHVPAEVGGLAALGPGILAVLQVTVHPLPPLPAAHAAHMARLCPGQWPSALVAPRAEPLRGTKGSVCTPWEQVHASSWSFSCPPMAEHAGKRAVVPQVSSAVGMGPS